VSTGTLLGKGGAGVGNLGTLGGGSGYGRGGGALGPVVPRSIVTTPAPDPAPPKGHVARNEPAPPADGDFDSAFGSPRLPPPPPKKPNTSAGYIPPGTGRIDGDVKESIGQSDIMEVVLANKGALGVCVERQRLVSPGIHGMLMMKWIIRINGTTGAIEVVSKEFENTEIARCITELIRKMQFPAHQRQGAAITFPFKF
jgi:hypothetical protein